MTPTPDDILEAVRGGDRERLIRLLEQAPELAGARTENGLTPLLAALYIGRDDLLEDLLAHGARHDLFSASAAGDRDAVLERLAAQPEGLSSYSADGWTPLHLAAFFGRLEVARLLLERGADVAARSRNENANLPLHAAAVRGWDDVVALLLEHGADPSATTDGGHSALMLAGAGGHVAVVERLLARGVAVEARDGAGLSALDHARQRDRAAVVEMLRTHGGHAGA